MRPVLGGLRFLLELGLLAGAAWAGLEVSWLVAIAAPVLVAVVWGLWIAPKAAHRLADPLRLAVEVVLFVAVGVALVAAGHAVVGVALAVASIAVAVALRATDSAA